ncbi:AsmA family protein [Limnospira platensis CENA597]|uniref:AsmA family protein n=1 Tax=Limnospira platensis TaxID=118562 RepID=UPI003D6E7C56
MTKKRKNWLTIAGIVGGVLIVLAAIINVTLSRVDGELQNYLENIVSSTLGVQAEIQSLSLDKFRGDLRVNNLTINNPDNFSTPHVIKIYQVDIDVTPRSLLTDVVEINNFAINFIDVNIEQRLLNNNILTIINNLKSTQPSEPRTPSETPEEKSQTKLKLNFDVIDVQNTKVNVTLAPLGFVQVLDFQLPNLRLTNVSSDDFEEILTSDFIREVVQDIFESIIRDGGEKIPEILQEAIAPETNPR